MADNTDLGAVKMIKAIIVDDEPLAHQVLLHHLTAHPNINVVGQYYSAKDALCVLAKPGIDLVFLDINMPELTGLELLKALANPPQVTINSAYQEYALAGFDLNVTDYLLKPVSAPRLKQALSKVCQRALPLEHQSKDITLKVDREKRKFALDTIEYIEAYGNYVKLHQADSFTLATTTLKQLNEQLAGTFIQIHKSYLINKNKVTAVNHEYVELTTGAVVKIGKSYKELSRTLL
ncbi:MULTISPECIES: LytTR family DNA-binding domain-containing protein [unclassified Pseudoalteromonas]|uniref:LytR/AlgR family response regulator transcription factor n=1 Tax=unclassified Pseudoalteromonas TaxID=194690 RepID=UPI001F3DC0F1|nr:MULTISPECIES: LytTR family DNA-binding domain-containing protein [unclassified Pseudoalteromonas]MDP2635195.1 LytTR family DNA-binding domain-containing protein [Pseudoalteromonas sp. 1_MG-2023]